MPRIPTDDSVPYKRHNAYEGKWAASNGAQFEVYYVDRAEARQAMQALYGGVKQPGHPQYVPVGWRWRATEDTAGPFSSSRAAYKNAMETLV